MKWPYWDPKHCFCQHSQLDEKFCRNTENWWNIHRFVRRVKVHFCRHQRLSLSCLVTSFLPAFLKYIYFDVEGLGDLGSMFFTFFLPPPHNQSYICFAILTNASPRPEPPCQFLATTGLSLLYYETILFLFRERQQSYIQRLILSVPAIYLAQVHCENYNNSINQ